MQFASILRSDQAMPLLRGLLLVGLLSLLGSTMASAQQSIQSYGPDFYTPFGPTSAMDTLDRIPAAGAVLKKANASGRGLNDNTTNRKVDSPPVATGPRA